MGEQIIQSLWIGNRLSRMEQLSIRSFLDHGHTFHLYTYEHVQGIPEQTIVKPAADILPAEDVFVYRRGYGKNSPSAFSNLFRYKLLLEKGGWWADLDAICLRPLDFPDEHVLGYERQPDGTRHIAIGLVKAPTQSPLLSYCAGYCQAVKKSKLRWGQIGPRLFARALQAVKLPVRVLPPEAFYPIDYWNVKALVRQQRIPEQCYSIHLWNSRWRYERLDPDGTYEPQCIYEKLKRAHGLDSQAESPRANGAESVNRPHFLKRAADRLRAAVSPSRRHSAAREAGPSQPAGDGVLKLRDTVR